MTFSGSLVDKRTGNNIAIICQLGNRGRFTLRFSPFRLFAVVCAAVCICFAAANGFPPKVPPAGEPSSGLDGLDNLLKNSAAAASSGSAQDKTLDAKVKLLVQEYLRVKNYEAELKERAAALDTVLKDALKLDYDFMPGGETEDDREEMLEDGTGAALGGPDESSGSVFRSLLPLSKSDGAQGSESEQASFDTLSLLEHQVEKLSTIPVGAPVIASKSSGFGWRRSPFGGRMRFHSGVDYSVEQRSRVAATADGVVLEAGFRGALGRTVRIDHGNGIETLFAHLSQISVSRGQRVCRDQQIGLVGSSGRSTGPHLHYEVLLNGDPQDPEHFVELAKILRFANIAKSSLGPG